MKQAKFFILTIPKDDFCVPEVLPQGVVYLRGQREVGEGGFEHWQLLACFGEKRTCQQAKSVFGRRAHIEPTRSAAAREYVWKEATSVGGTRFEIGREPVRRNSKTDWSGVWSAATGGNLMEIPSPVRVAHYRTLRTIRADHSDPKPMEREIVVYCGRTGAGKSKKAWEEAGWGAYPKDPRTKFWDGYRDHEHVVIDEFRGGIDIGHVLRWFDRYPVLVEIKGSSMPLVARKIWITSNLHPRDWYPGLDIETLNALLRRIKVTEFF